MKTYNDEIANNPKAELIHISLDDPDSAKSWAIKEQMPWPTVLEGDYDRKQLVNPYFPSGKLSVPNYILVDNQGNEVARGKSDALAMIKKSK